MHKRKTVIRLAARLEREPMVPVELDEPAAGRRQPRLTGSIVVTIADGKRAPAARSSYHEPELERREGVHRIRDMGCDAWQESLSVVLSPSHGCRLSDLVHGVVDRLEARLGRSLEWSAWSHRDTPHPHAHLILRADGIDRGRLERAIRAAGRDAYGEIRERQRAYARERERERGLER